MCPWARKKWPPKREIWHFCGKIIFSIKKKLFKKKTNSIVRKMKDSSFQRCIMIKSLLWYSRLISDRLRLVGTFSDSPKRHWFFSLYMPFKRIFSGVRFTLFNKTRYRFRRERLRYIFFRFQILPTSSRFQAEEILIFQSAFFCGYKRKTTCGK